MKKQIKKSTGPSQKPLLKKVIINLLKLIGFLTALTIVQVPIQMIIYWGAENISSEFLFKLVNVVVEVLASLLVVKLFLWKKSFREIGFRLRIRKREFLIALLALPVGVLIMLLIVLLGGLRFERFLWDKYFFDDTIPIIIAYMIHSLGTAVIEGVTIRGYVFSLMEVFNNKYVGIFGTAIIQALFVSLLGGYFDPLQFIGIFLMSVLLTLIVVLTKNLSASILFHSLWYFVTMYLFFVRDPEAVTNFGVINFNITDKVILSGGLGGVLGSIIFIAIALIVDTILILKLRAREK